MIKNFIIKFIMFVVLSFVGGFVSAFLKDIGTKDYWVYMVHFAVGYFSCMIWNWRW